MGANASRELGRTWRWYQPADARTADGRSPTGLDDLVRSGHRGPDVTGRDGGGGGGDTPSTDVAAAKQAESTPTTPATPPTPPTPAEAKPVEIKPAETKSAETQTPTAADEVHDSVAEAKQELAEAADELEDAAAIVGRISNAGGAGPAPGWFKRHAVNPPRWNPQKLDVDKYIDWAIAEAKRAVPGARLTWISISGVYPSGVADLALVDGYIDLRFISPSRSARPTGVPRGVKATNRECEFRIMGNESSVDMFDMSDFGNCQSVPIQRPRCSMKQVWAKARAKHPKIDDAVAELIYMTNIVSHKVVWSFRIDDEGGSDISEQLTDDC